MSSRQSQVVVIGAGFAGLMAARRLAWKTRGSGAAITLVSAMDYFVERLRLHQLAASQPIAQRPLASMLRRTGVSFVHGAVTAIRPEQGTMIVQSGDETSEIRYDYLVYALGSTIDRDRVPGVREHAHVLTPAGEKSAAALRERLPTLNAAGGRVLICGGGATGIEAAAEFADAFPDLRVHLVTQGEFGAFIGRKVADYMYQSLRRLGVTIQDRTTITEVQAAEAVTEDGALIPFDVCLWAGGFTALPLARESGLAVNELGQIIVDPYMRSISHPEIYAAGDAAHPVEDPGVPVRMSAFTALVTGAHAADCLSAHLRGTAPRPLNFVYYGQAIALGRHDAIGFAIYPADRASAPYFKGWAGYLYREFFVNFALALPRIERRPGFRWLRERRRAAAKRKAERAAQTRESSGAAWTRSKRTAR